jgi:predicted cupin superfamily sugar epimerase
LPPGNYSAFHRLQGDETWHLYVGGPVTLYIITQEGELKEKKLGRNLDKGEHPQLLVKREQWFSAVADEDNFALVGCVMAPGFEFDDLELGNEEELIKTYPQYEAIIKKYSAESLGS